MKYFAAFLMFTSSLAHAGCPTPVSYLTEGSKASCNGYLFSPEKELEVRTKLEHYDDMSQLIVQQDGLITNLKSQIDLDVKQIDEQKTVDSIDKVFYFVLGVVATSLAVYVGNKAR
jgi:hypothetical protein